MKIPVSQKVLNPGKYHIKFKMNNSINIFFRSFYKNAKTQNVINNCSLWKKNLNTSEAIEKRSYLFTLEKKRQTEDVGRVEKIEVQYKGVPEDATLIMNKDLSTPYDCAKHLSETHMSRSALALIDGTKLWDMHRPLDANCTLQLLNYTSDDPSPVNGAFWRTCSFLLGAVVSASFKDHIQVRLHSFPVPDVRSGSFVYDVDLIGLPDWTPTDRELRTLSAEFVKLCRRGNALERLDVTQDLALEMFEENRYKLEQIPNIAAKNDGRVTLYRVGDHVDISKGPMVSHAAHIGRVTLSAVHQLDNHAADTVDHSDNPIGKLYRFQGLALPVGIIINHFAYGILEDRARKLNPAKTPFEKFPHFEESEIQNSVEQ